MPTRTHSDHKLSPRKQNAIVMLIFAMAIVIGARFILSDPDSGGPLHLSIPLVGDIRTPLCPSRMITGVPCPLCGITRSMAHMARGRIVRGYQEHSLGPVIAALVLLTIPYSIFILATPDPAASGKTGKERIAANRIITASVVGLIIIAWVLNLVRFYSQ